VQWVKKIDHVAYACAKGMIKKWAWYHIEVEGGTLITRIDDVDPTSEDSSMKLWCVSFGSFGIALVEGIDRKKRSQVSTFVELHGDHSVQHVAFATADLVAFLERLHAHGVSPRGDVYTRHDGFGVLRQVFCKGYSAQDAAEMSFPEYLERPSAGREGGGPQLSFSPDAGRVLYQQIEQARDAKDRSTLLSFSAMPKDWQPPTPANAKPEKAHGRTPLTHEMHGFQVAT
jgi:hypothetical protein